VRSRNRPAPRLGERRPRHSVVPNPCQTPPNPRGAEREPSAVDVVPLGANAPERYE
jgi:hypothetical protein